MRSDRAGWRAVRAAVVAALVVGGLILEARAAVAQDQPFSFSLLGGGTFPLSDAHAAMGLGWNLGVAGDLRLTSAIHFRADYLYDRFGSKDKTIDVGLGPMLPAVKQVSVDAKSQMHFVSFDLEWTRESLSGRRVYVIGGPTWFRRRAQLRAADDHGYANACEPQWLQCASETIGFDRWLGIKESDDWGFNAGAGVAFKTGLTAMVAIEARYYYVFGPSFTSTTGAKQSASAMFVPISVGLRF